jgi:maleate isomerase
MYYGWRKKIGLIFPATGTAPEVEFHRYAPPGVAVMTQRVLFERVDPRGLVEMGDRTEEAARILAAGGPDIIAFACTTGSLIKGLGYDQELVKRLEKASGTKALTTSTALTEALRKIGAKRIIVPTPYSDEVNQIEKKFLEDSGFEVLAIKGLSYTDPAMMPRVTPDQMYRLTGEIFDKAADTIFISCTGLGIFDLIEMAEADFQRPVLTSNQVTLWAALRTLGIHDTLPLGRLFEL